MATKFGIELRKIRLMRGDNLQNMAEKVGLSMSYMSSIENGIRKIPKDLTMKVIEVYTLNEEEKTKLIDAENNSIEEVSIDLINLNHEQKELALLLSRKLPKVKNSDELMRMILTEDDDE